MSPVPIIEIKNLSKQYGKGKGIKAVDQLDLMVEEGDIFGFVGPNGAGKTSTIRIMCTLLQATQGDVLVAGHSASKQPRLVRNAIGYMPDFFGVYNDLTVAEYLDFFGACYKIPDQQRKRLIDDLLELVDLKHRRNDQVLGLSRGMKQRLSLARTLIHDPQVLVLDEPASGLDPRARVEIRELLVELAHMGKTIFFSTHILSDVAEICTRVGIIEAGKLVALGGLEELQLLLVPNRKLQITILGNYDTAEEILQSTEGVIKVQIIQNNHGNGGRCRLEMEYQGDDKSLSLLLAKLVSAEVAVINFSEETRDMEEVFLRATKGLVT
jgi:ABC-2 type transport system ATP-binding protein